MAAIEQAGQVLDVLREHDGPVSFIELVQRTGLAKSSVHNVLEQMTDMGWVERLDGGKYRVGLRLLELASSRLNDMDVVRQFIERRDHREILPNEAIVLSMLVGQDVLYLACRNGNRPIGLQYRIGMRLPAATTASGKAALALEEEPAVRARFPDDIVTGRDGLEAKTVDDLLVELAEIRVRGYSVDDEETAPGMLCFGAALDEPVGKNCAVAISMIKASVGKDEYERFGKEIMELARSLR